MPITPQATETTYRGITPAVIIDVRTPHEFAAGHVAGAVNIPVEQIVSGIRDVKGLTKDQPILLYCQSGYRSGVAQTLLLREGYEQPINGGGIASLARELGR